MKGIVAIVLAAGILSFGCSDSISFSRGVYVLMDPSDTSPTKPGAAQQMIYTLLGILKSNDSLSVARFDSDRFSDKDVAAKVTFGQRPSVTNHQKRAFAKNIGGLMVADETRKNKDLSGGFWHAAEALRDAQNGRKIILIYSNLKDKLVDRPGNEGTYTLSGIEVVALTPTLHNQPGGSTQAKIKRADLWRQQIEIKGGRWRVAHNLDHLRRIIEE